MLDLPDSAPDESPFYLCRFNREWLAIILGALQDNWDNPAYYDPDSATYSPSGEVWDELYAMLCTEVLPDVSTRSGVISCMQWRDVRGTWLVAPNPGVSWSPLLYNSSNQISDACRTYFRVEAGTYRFWYAYGKSTAYQLLQINAVDANGSTQIDLQDEYAAAPNHEFTRTFNYQFTADFDGELELVSAWYPGRHTNGFYVLIGDLGYVRTGA